MKNFSGIYVTVAALLALSFYGCAIRKGPPEGGAIDETPPKVVSENPANGTVNFNEKKIVISFDEYIELNNAFREVQVTPTTGKAPTLNLNKKSLIIDTAGMHLQPNTTYTIQFGNAIGDINEANTLVGYQYIFSTGSYIDSLYIEGNIIPADQVQDLEKVRMQLYPESNDTGLYKGRPAYMVVAEEGGYFKIGNLPKGRFRLYAVEDKNENYTLEPGERVGFAPGVLSLDTGLRLDEIVLFPEPARQFRFTHVSATPARLRLKASQPIDSIEIGYEGGVYTGYPSWNIGKDSLVFWFDEAAQADQGISITAYSSIYQADTFIRPVIDPKDTGRTMYLVMDQSPDNPVQFNSPLVLRFTEPVRSIDYRKIYFTSEDSLDLPGLRFRFADSSRMILAALYPFEENDKYRISFGNGAFTSIRGRIQDSTFSTFAAPSRRDFGLLEIHVSTPPGQPYIFELLNPSGTTIYTKTIAGAEIINLPYVQPGSYKLRLIGDINNNGRWDTGDISKGTQPEPIYYHSQEIAARANWELAGIIFDITNLPKQ